MAPYNNNINNSNTNNNSLMISTNTGTSTSPVTTLLLTPSFYHGSTKELLHLIQQNMNNSNIIEQSCNILQQRIEHELHSIVKYHGISIIINIIHRYIHYSNILSSICHILKKISFTHDKYRRKIGQ